MYEECEWFIVRPSTVIAEATGNCRLWIGIVLAYFSIHVLYELITQDLILSNLLWHAIICMTTIFFISKMTLYK